MSLENSGGGDIWHLLWISVKLMGPQMRMRSCRGSRWTREDAESSKVRKSRWTSLEYACIIEEEKSDDPLPYHWHSFYQREMSEETEEAI